MVLVGTLLSLWVSWNQIPFVTCQTLRRIAELVDPMLLTPEERYVHYIELTSRSFYNHQYDLAAIYADIALQNRVCLKAFEVEEVFLDRLIALGKYKQAKDLIPKLAPLEKRLTPMSAYRQELLGQACMGLHEYQSAVETFGRNIPDLVRSNGMKQVLELRLFIAYMCLGDYKSAKVVVKHLRYSRDTIEPSYRAVTDDNPLLNLFEPLLSLAPNNYRAAATICDNHIRFWQRADYLDDPDAVPMLLGASKIMLDYGFTFESDRLKSCADRLRRHKKVNDI